MKTCKKTSFADEKSALEYIDKLSRTSKRTTVPKRAYLCTDCTNWHLTSKGEYSRTFDGVVQENEDLRKEVESLKKQIGKSTNKDSTIKTLEKALSKRNNKITNLNKQINNLKQNLSVATKEAGHYRLKYSELISKNLTKYVNLMESKLKELGFERLYKSDECWYKWDLMFDPKTKELLDTDEVHEASLVAKITSPDHLEEVVTAVGYGKI